MSFLQRHVREIGIYGQRDAKNLWEAIQRSKTFMDGLNSYRSHAFARMPTQG